VLPSDESPRERLEASINSPYDTDGEVWNALLAACASEYEELETALRAVLAAKSVTSASGEQLDQLATIFEIERRTGEPDAKFRLRIQTALRRLISSGTIDEIRETIAVLLETSQSEVLVDEPYDVEPARVDLSVWESELSDAGFSLNEFADIANDLTAGGVGVEMFARGTFQFTSENSTVNSDRGFAELNSDNTGPVEGTGGTWPKILR